jgi:hypothetical protein
MPWVEEKYRDTFFYQVLRRDDGMPLGSIMRFYSEDCPTYAIAQNRRLGPYSTDDAARKAVEDAVGT